MPDQIGSLVVTLTADAAQLTTEMSKAVGSVNLSLGQMTQGVQGFGGVLGQLDRQVQQFGVSLGALGGVAAGVGLGALVNSAVEAQVQLLHLSERVGTTVEQMSALVPAAKTSETSLDEVAVSSTKLSKTLADGGAAGEKATSVLAALGFTSQQIKSFLDQPATAMYDIGKALNTIPDSGTKAAVAMALFGKAGADLLPFLKTLGEQTELTSTLTTAQAVAADTYSTTLTNLGLEMQKVVLLNVGALLPTLTAIGQGFVDLNKNATNTPGIMTLIGGSIAVFAIGLAGVSTGIKNISIAFQAAYADIKLAATGNFAAIEPLNDKYAAQQLQNSKALAAFVDTVKASTPLLGGSATALASTVQPATASADALKKLQAVLAALGGSGKGGDGAGAQFINSILEQNAALSASEEAMLDAKADALGLLDVTRDMISAFVENKREAQDEADAIKKSADEWKAYGEALTPLADVVAKQEVAITDLLKSVDLETASLTLNDTEKQRSAAIALLNASNIDKESDAYKNLLAQINQTYDTQAFTKAGIAAAKELQKDYTDTAKTINDALVNALYDGFKKGASAGQDLANFLEQTFKKLVLQPLLAPISGSIASLLTPGSAGAATGTGGISVSNLGSIFSSLTSGFSTFGTSLSALTSNIGLVADAGLDAVGGLSGLATSVGAVLGPIGAVAGLAYLAYNLFASKGGGPKSGGFGSTDPSINRYYTPNTADADLGTLASGTQSTFNSSLSALGGTGSANFAFGYDTDPNGTANSRTSAGAYVNGNKVYGVVNQDEGRGTAKAQADLSLEAQRALLAALQASSLPTAIAAILNSVTASSASATQITNVIALGTALKTVTDTLAKNPVADALSAIAASSNTATSALQTQITAATTLASSFQGTAAQSAALAASAQSIYAAEVQVIGQAEQVRTSLGTLFGDTIKNFTLSTLSTAGKNKYYQQDEASLKGQLQTATDPAQIQSLTQQMIADLNASFQLLTPAQQAQQLGQYTAAVQSINAQATARINAVETTTQTTANNALNTLQAAISAAAATNTTAANTQAQAATTNLTAANKPIALNVVVSLKDGTAEVNAGG